MPDISNYIGLLEKIVDCNKQELFDEQLGL